jgi:hypothetical protein
MSNRNVADTSHGFSSIDMKFRWWYSLRKSDKLSASWSVFLLTTRPEATFFCHSLIFALLLLPFTDFIFKASNLTVCLIKLRLKVVALDLSCLAIRFERIRLLSKCRKLRAKCRYWRTISNIEIESVDQRFQRPSHRSQSNRPITSSKAQTLTGNYCDLRKRIRPVPQAVRIANECVAIRDGKSNGEWIRAFEIAMGVLLNAAQRRN